MKVLDGIRSELGSFLSDAVEFVFVRTAEVPVRSERKWKIVRPSAERELNQEIEKLPNLSGFLWMRRAELLAFPSFSRLIAKLRTATSVLKALRLENFEGEIEEEFCNRYLDAVTEEAVRRVSVGVERGKVIDDCLHSLDEFISRDTISARFFAPLLNFRSAAVDVEIADGVYLRSISDSKLEGYVNSLGDLVSFSDLFFLLRLAFELETCVQQDRTSPTPLPMGGQIQTRSEDLLKALRLTKRGAVGFAFVGGEAQGVYGPGASWRGTPGHTRPQGTIYELDACDVPNIGNILSKLKGMASAKRFSLALDRFFESYQKPEGGDRLIDYWIALESLLMPEDEVGELKYRVALRAAFYVGSSSNREQVFKEMQNSYKVRSKFVHGNPVDVDPSVVVATEHYLRQVLCRCLDAQEVPKSETLNALVLGTHKAPAK